MEEEQEQKRNGRRRAGKLMPKFALCKNLQKLALVPILAIFGTMPILALILALEKKLALVPILTSILALEHFWHWCQFWHWCGANYGRPGKLALVPILALDFGIDSNFCIGANFGIGFLAL